MIAATALYYSAKLISGDLFLRESDQKRRSGNQVIATILAGLEPRLRFHHPARDVRNQLLSVTVNPINRVDTAPPDRT
jgi:hypothetical protein